MDMSQVREKRPNPKKSEEREKKKEEKYSSWTCSPMVTISLFSRKHDAGLL